jgi:WD40 repeat protein
MRRDGTHAEALRLLDSASGKTAQTLEGHTGKIWNTTWSPDGKQLASVGEDATCRLWDAETGQEIAAFRHTKEQCWLTWSADGKYIACASPFSDITVWDARQHKQIREFNTLKKTFGQPGGNSFFCPFDFLKDANLLMVMDGSSGLEICNLKSGAVLDAGKAAGSELGSPNGIQWSPDFKTMLAGGGLQAMTRLRLYVSGQKASRTIRYTCSSAWLADSRRIVSGNDYSAPVTGYDTKTGRRLGVLLNMAWHPEHLEWAMIGPDGNYTSSPGAADHLAVTAILDDGRCVTLTLEEFEQQYGWKNNPDKARFLNLK